VSSPAAATVVALMRDLPKSMKLADLGEALLDNGSAEQLWDAHVDAALLPARERSLTAAPPPATSNSGTHLEATAVAELRELFGTVTGPDDPLWMLQVDVCRAVLAAGGIPADELTEWLAVARQREATAKDDG
jgi:hypothetical protein